MKPYLLVAHNLIRLNLWRWFCCHGLHFQGISMLSRNTRLMIDKTARVTFGERIVSDGRTVLTVGANANLTIGNGVYFNEDAMISCKEAVTISDGCRFGPNVKVFDNDHKFDASNGVSAYHLSTPVTIGKNCWLASNVVILRGTTIGDNCVIGANCVVKGIIPAGSVVTQSRELVIKPIKNR